MLPGICKAPLLKAFEELKHMWMFCEECQICITFNDKIIDFKQNLLLALAIMVMLAVRNILAENS